MTGTTIYWLVDTRYVARKRGWPIGEPFYCGRTTSYSVMGAVYSACYGNRTLAQRIKACGDQLRIHVVAEVPIPGDGYTPFFRGVERLRHLNPDCVNKALWKKKGTKDRKPRKPQFSIIRETQKRKLAALHEAGKISPAAKRRLRAERQRLVRLRSGNS